MKLSQDNDRTGSTFSSTRGKRLLRGVCGVAVMAGVLGAALLQGTSLAHRPTTPPAPPSMSLAQPAPPPQASTGDATVAPATLGEEAAYNTFGG